MGLENREYLRNDYDDGPQGGSLKAASIVVKLIVVTCAVFLLQILFRTNTGGASLTEWLQLTREDLFLKGQIWRLLTYAFCHDLSSPFHLIFNMVMLYSIGGMLLNLIGEREFLWFYIACSIFAGICSVAAYAIMGRSPAIIGASGAVLGIFCVIAMHYPRQKLLLMGVVPVEMRWLLAFFVAFDVIPLVAGLSNYTKVAHSAHLGGLLFGFLYVRWNMRLTRWWDQFAGRMATKRKNKGKLKIFAPPSAPDSNLSAQVDEILEKISREGEASLTARERNILTQASRQLRKDRR